MCRFFAPKIRPIGRKGTQGQRQIMTASAEQGATSIGVLMTSQITLFHVDESKPVMKTKPLRQGRQWADKSMQIDLVHVDDGMDQAMAEVEAGALFVINHSGGKDSQAMMIKLLEYVPKSQILVVHASLGRMEWEGALEQAHQQATDAGVPFIVAYAAKSFVEMVMHRFATAPTVPSWPSPQHRQCTSDLKRGPITREVRRWAKANGFNRIVNCMGMRAQESHTRAKKSVWSENSNHGKAGRSWYDFNAIHAMSEVEVYETIKKAGQVPHWAYVIGNERLSCVFCIMASVNDLTLGALHNRQLYAEYCALERLTGYVMHSSLKTLPELTGIEPMPLDLTDVFNDFLTRYAKND